MTEINEGGINRRSVVKAAAWAAPVVAVAAAAPMAAATPPPPVATQARIEFDSGYPVGQWGDVTVRGRATQGGIPVNGSFPVGTVLTLTPAAGTTITLGPNSGFTSITPGTPGPGQSVTLTVSDAATSASVLITIDVPGVVAAAVTGPVTANASGDWIAAIG